jgi:predicted XRE-type DNA-binding protein
LIRGVFVEVIPHERVAIDMTVADADGRRLFKAETEVTFADDAIGARMDVVQNYAFFDPAMAAPMVWGASEGWHTSLDKLEAEVTRACADVSDALEDAQAESASMAMRSDLMVAIGERVKSWDMAPTKAAGRLGVTELRLDDLMRGKFQNFSLDALVDLAATAGLSVRLDIAT